MPYRIILQQARRVLGCKQRSKAHGVSQFFADRTDSVEVRNCKGLLLFYRPRRPMLKA